MSKSQILRVDPGAKGVSIWSSEIFGDASPLRVRDFLARAFSIPEVETVELRRASSFGRIRYGSVAEPAGIWRKLGRALKASDAAASESAPPGVDAALVYLDIPGSAPVHVSRIGETLSTWRVRGHGESTLRLWHPVLRRRRDRVYRLEEALAAMYGVEAFSTNVISGAVSIRFDKRALSAERLVRKLEEAWPQLLDGPLAPPSRTRLVASAGLVGLAFTGQYVVPALRPIAVAGVALYSSPNVVSAAKQLRHGEVGLSALYSTGLALMLFSGMPFASAAIAVLMQLWPQLAHGKLVRSQRRVFAPHRRRPAWTRIATADGGEVEISVDDLRKGDLVSVREGELIAVDGIVHDGHATVLDPLTGHPSEDKATGDAVAAGTYLVAGSLTIRVERVGEQTLASFVESLLPHAPLAELPSSDEVERIANRNARYTLAFSALSFALTRSLRPSQAMIRPDYATAPRLSAQLSALHAVAQGLQHGILFRNPSALDRIPQSDVFVIDDSAGLERRSVEVATVQSVSGVSADLVAGYAVVAQRAARGELGQALLRYTSRRKRVRPQPASISLHAGAIRYCDSLGHTIEIASPRYLAASHIATPQRFKDVVGGPNGSSITDEPALRPLWVLRDGEVIGVVSFARSGDAVGKNIIAALKAQNPRARIVYLSRGAQGKARELARSLGIEHAYGGLSQPAKASLIRGLGRKVVWVGNGSEPEARESIAASAVSVSVAELAHAREDGADILLPHKGLSGLPDVTEVSRAHARRISQDYRTVYTVNLLGVAGAFFARFSSLHSGLLSNFGTGLIYARHAHGLNRLASAAERARARLTGSSPR